MSYRVDYHTLALMEDGTNGNVLMEIGTVFTDSKIELIPEHLNDFLVGYKRIGIVKSITFIKAKCIGHNYLD